MIRLVTRGRLTQNYAKSFLAAPENREPAVRKLIEAAGGKLINFYFTPGDSDFLLISEANDAENIIAALMAAAAAGTISDVTTARAWTGAEFKAIGDKACQAAGAYRVPGKKKWFCNTIGANRIRRDGGNDVNDPNLREHSRDLPIGLSP
jgi:uncharacterized protein with GYD domain